MEKKEIRERNVQIGIMIGAKHSKDRFGNDVLDCPDNPFWYHTEWSNYYQENIELYSYKYDNLRFHYDWNWLMQAVKKTISLLDPSDSRRHDLIVTAGSGNTKHTFEKVSDFAKIYNQ